MRHEARIQKHLVPLFDNVQTRRAELNVSLVSDKLQLVETPRQTEVYRTSVPSYTAARLLTRITAPVYTFHCLKRR
jgi:hypothetical protein